MVYSTLTQVKYWIPEVVDASFDAELSDIQTQVSYTIDNIVQQYTHLPIQNTYVTTILGDIEAEWCAARYRKRRPTSNPDVNDRVKDYENEARARLNELMVTTYNRISKFVGVPRSIGNSYPIQNLTGGV